MTQPSVRVDVNFPHVGTNYNRCIDIGNAVKGYTDFELFIKHIAKTDLERFLLSKLTQKQAASPAWMKARLFRITASVCSELVTVVEKFMSTSAGFYKASLIKKANEMYLKHSTAANMLLFAPSSQHKRNFPACQWGIDNESTAREKYLAFNTHLHCEQMGIVVSRSGALGASPDGVLFRNTEYTNNPEHWDKGELLEIKCPYKCRDTKGKDKEETVDLVVSQLDYLMFTSPGTIELNQANAQGRKYFHQVQMGMHVLGLKRCHFLIWTPHISISFAVLYLESWDQIAKNLEFFWVNHLMPVLWSKSTFIKPQKEQDEPAVKKPRTSPPAPV